MADFIYLLQTRLNAAQRAALAHVQTAAKSRNITIFLVGGAVRDLTTGSPIRDLDVVVQGNALKLKKDLEKAGGTVIGENEAAQQLYLNFPGGVRLEVGSTLSVSYLKPGKPVYKPANILDDLRRRDFTANAMAISLNDGSYGLLMDPLNGMGDLENRELRLVSNYGFIEDPVRMIRAVRFSARLGWQMEEKTRQRYETGKSEGYIAALSPIQRSYELEEVFHEEDPLRVQRRLESEGWAKVLSPVWTAAKANENELNRLRDLIAQFNEMGIYPDPSPAYFPLLTAKLQSKDISTLKKSFARPGFAAQIAALESATKAFSTQFTSKAAAAPSDAWKLLYSSQPEPVLALAFASKTGPPQSSRRSLRSGRSPG
jgi:tRNA nucleotidyltransferase/poly(A) polymerase